MHSSDERNDRQRSFDREAFRQAFMARIENNVENDEWSRRRRWMSTTSSLSDSRQPLMSSRPPLVELNNSTAPALAVVKRDAVLTNERGRNISSIEISSPAKRRLWLLGQRYSSSSSSSNNGDAESVAGSSSSSSATRSIAGPVSPPSLRNKRNGKLENYNPLQMLLLHANRHDNEVGSIERDSISSIHEEHNTQVQGGHLLQLLNQLARSNDAQPTQSPPRHLDVTLNSTDDDDGSSMLSNVSSFISPTQIFCADSEMSEIGVIEEDEEDSRKEESDYFSSFCKVQTILSELDQEHNSLQLDYSVGKNAKDDDDEDWGLLSCIALSILAVVTILLALSGLFSLQAKVDYWKESLAIRLWETIKTYKALGLEQLKELHPSRISLASALLRIWVESLTGQLLGIMERCAFLYVNTLDDLLHQWNLIVASFSLSKVTSVLTQQLERTTTYFSNMDVASATLEQLYRVAKVYYSAVELFKIAQHSLIELQASTGLTWNATLLVQQVGAAVSESKNWLVAPLSYNTQDNFSISKSSLTIPIMFDVRIGHYSNETIWYQEENEIQLQDKEMSLYNSSPPFWRCQPRAFIKRTLPVPDSILITQPTIKHVENVGHSLVASENLTALVVQRMKRNAKQPSKPKKNQKKVRDYYDSVIQQQKQSNGDDVFDGVDAMSIASDAIVRWWHQYR
eukprot:scaffold3901_cov135-Skeletonema_menzelii.AAC.1